MNEIFTLERQYDINEYDKINFAIANTMTSGRMSLLENLQYDNNDSGVIVPECFTLVDCDMFIDIDMKCITFAIQFSCEEIAIKEMLITNADRISIGYYINHGNPTIEVLWNRYGEFNKHPTYEQFEGHDDEGLDD